MSRRSPSQPEPDQPEPDPMTDEERFRRWFVCPVIDCDTVEEHDGRPGHEAHYCPSEKHPSYKMRVMFAGRLMP